MKIEKVFLTFSIFSRKLNFSFEKSNTFIPYNFSELMENIIDPKNVESVNIKKTNIGNISRNNKIETSLKSKLTKPSEITKFDCSNDKDANITLKPSYIEHF